MKNRPLVRPVHAGVPGRVRLDVDGLYQSKALKRRVEDALGGLSCVSSVQANTRTGRVLVLYAGDDVSGRAWRPRGWNRRRRTREDLFRLALHACARL